MRPSSRLWIVLEGLACVFLVVMVVDAIMAQARAGSIGNDYLAFDAAARRMLHGESLYDLSLLSAPAMFGVAGAYFYPPPFAFLLLPLTIFPTNQALGIWFALIIASTVAAFLLMPVPRWVRVSVILLAAASWPVIFAIRLGQVGPLLLLLFALGWRALDRQVTLGATIALGAATKIQPIILLGWAALTGRWRAFVAGAVVLVALAIASTAIAGPRSWLDEWSLLSQGTTGGAHNLSFGRLAEGIGASPVIVQAIVIGGLVVTVALLIWAARFASLDASYLAFAIGSQLLSVVLWDHYAIVLFLPLAWLLARGVYWVVVLPLAMSLPLVHVVPTVVYPVAFWVFLVLVVWKGASRRDPSPGAAPIASGATPARDVA